MTAPQRDNQDRRWQQLYSTGLDPTPTLVFDSIPEAWRSRVAAAPDRIAIAYADQRFTARNVDAMSDALATVLQSRGVRPGDHVGVYMQNIPQYPLALLALWKIGAVAVPINPMYRRAELRHIVDDAHLVGIIAGPTDRDELRETLNDSSAQWVLSASDADFPTSSSGDTPGSAPDESPRESLRTVLDEFIGRVPVPHESTPDDLALITYTSGTTGSPKGALNTHANFLHAASNYATWVALSPGDVVLAIAPLFHITGLTLNAGISLLTDTTLVLTGRFDPGDTVRAIRDHGVTFTIGSITAFNAMLAVDSAGTEDFRSVKSFYSGGAPIPPSTITTFRDRFEIYLHNVWGMTETTAGGIAVPRGASAPVHGPSGTLSVGVPMQNVTVRIVDPEGNDVAPGEPGELEFDAPQVIPGYWQNAEATAQTFPEGRLRTGDVAIMDADGWVYLVDRLKDLINASGFKVWPREVEDVLYQHPAVFEAAVVGEPDEYRGETVVAYVSLVNGSRAEPDELVAFVKERIAAYKYPRRVYLVDQVPKTATGKIQRSVLRPVPQQ